MLWGWGYDYNNKNYNTPKIEIQKRYVRQYFDIQIGSFDNRNEIKWNIPISFFFVLKKRSGMPVNKGITGWFLQSEKIEVRYQVFKKFGFRGVRVVSLHQLSQTSAQHGFWEPVLVALHPVYTDLRHSAFYVYWHSKQIKHGYMRPLDEKTNN